MNVPGSEPSPQSPSPNTAAKARAVARDRRPSPRPSANHRRVATRSRWVGIMKVAFPLVALSLIALVVAWPYVARQDQGFRLGFAVLENQESRDPSMVNARFHGVDADKNPYAITADFARNLTRDTVRVDLERPKADMALEDGTWLVLTAKTGHFYRQQKSLDLIGTVNLFHDTGYEFNTSKASVDLSNAIASSDVFVTGHGPFGTLQAEGFRILNKEKVIHFAGKSQVVLYPGPDQGGR